MGKITGHWRLLTNPPKNGYWNMGVDEALLESASRSSFDATLRLYSWQPACLSLGFGQPFKDVHVEQVNENGWQVVRRITGGRAILHTDELTYAVVGRPDEGLLQGDITQSYKRISAALVSALEFLGLLAESNENPSADRGGEISAICYEAPGAFEITVAGRKLIGSAQARRSYGVLQHGSLPLSGDITRIIQALRYEGADARAAAAQRLREKAVTIEAAVGKTVSWQAAAQAFVKAFEQRLGVEFTQTELSRGETRRAEELAQKKYSRPEWLERI